jgi:hypothetical protein
MYSGPSTPCPLPPPPPQVGCGVGNAIFPLLELHPHLFVYGLDFSARAIELVRGSPLFPMLTVTMSEPPPWT